MCVLILLYGMLTRSWYALLAFRMRVSMSAIGSVIVMGFRPFSPWFPEAFGDSFVQKKWGLPGVLRLPRTLRLPGTLRDARQLAAVRHLAQADAAESERPEDRPGTTAALAAGVAPDVEF